MADSSNFCIADNKLTEGLLSGHPHIGYSPQGLYVKQREKVSFGLMLTTALTEQDSGFVHYTFKVMLSNV